MSVVNRARETKHKDRCKQCAFLQNTDMLNLFFVINYNLFFWLWNAVRPGLVRFRHKNTLG